MFGDPREMILHYFLADDTVEIREVVTQNSGRDAVPLFLRRQRLPKVSIRMFPKCLHTTAIQCFDQLQSCNMS